MPALFTNQFHAVQNKTCLAIYSIYSVYNNILLVRLKSSTYTTKIFTIKNQIWSVFFIQEPIFLCQAEQVLIYLGIKCKISACRFLNHQVLIRGFLLYYIRSDIFYLFNEPKFKFTIQKKIMTFSQTVSGNSTIDKFLLSKVLMEKQQEMTDILQPFGGAYSVLLTVELSLIITSSLVNMTCDVEATKIDLMDTRTNTYSSYQ